MPLANRLLWIDGSGGALVGVFMLLASGPLSTLYRLPQDFVLLIAAVNLAYGCNSLTLASRRIRPMALILLLIVANFTWGVAFCFRWAYVYSGTAGFWGLAHLVGEGLWVIGLAALEWRHRESLRVRAD